MSHSSNGSSSNEIAPMQGIIYLLTADQIQFFASNKVEKCTEGKKKGRNNVEIIQKKKVKERKEGKPDNEKMKR